MASDPSDPPPPRVLVVDDDPEIRTLLNLALRRAGLLSVEASGGSEALSIIGSAEISIVVCDLGMPGMSGLDVVRALRDQPATATLPFLLLTGSGDADTVLEAFAAGVDDFVAKPVRMEELVARVRAHVRTGAAWRLVLETELRARADAVRALSQLSVSSVPEEAAATVVSELARRTAARYVGILQLSGGARLRPLATFTTGDGLVRGGSPVDPGRSRDLLSRARVGPWAVPIGAPDPGEPSTPFWDAGLDVAAGAGIHAGEDLVGILTVGTRAEDGLGATPADRARLLGRVIDYASVLSATFGPAIAERRQVEVDRTRLRRLLHDGGLTTVYQPIVDLESAAPIGFESLSRFSDGTRPDVRFSEARTAGLAGEYEMAAVRSAIEQAVGLASGAFLSVNLSSDLVEAHGVELARLVAAAGRPIVIEVTEHAQIDDYAAFRGAVERIGAVRLAVDDAGAGFASLRHILEIGPAFAKLDISLVRGIDGDPLRQALAAGLAYFALRSGCDLIAEGIETEAEAMTLMDIGVEFGQGFLFGRPSPPPD